MSNAPSPVPVLSFGTPFADRIGDDVDPDPDPDATTTAVADTPDDTPLPERQSTPYAALLNNKRVLPSRSRRGGPGVGHCDIDQTILEAQRRAEQNQPLIHPTSIFRLVTDANLVEEFVAEDGGKNEAHLAYFYQSYFDRPEVIKSFRQQEAIETPVWGQIPKDAVGGRLRHRNGVEDHFDTSDHAYIQRHRKFETFEKRQRRREKEKLEHEHHKLKNRIDQLRALDAPAFGGKDITESEKNRDNMLATAVDLEQRYRVLLPDPRRPDKRRPGIDEAALPPNSTSDSRVKVTIKLPASVTPEVFPTNPEISAPQTPGTSPRRLPKQKNIRKRKGQRAVSQDVIPSDSRITNHISVPTSSIRVHAGSSRYGSRYFPDPANSIGSAPDSPGAVSGPEDEDPYSWSEAPLSSRPYKKQRRGTSLGPRSEDANRSVSDGALLRAARWAEGASRKTKRGVDPFGVRLPDMFNVLTDFDIWSPASFFKECLGEARETTLEESHEEIQVKNAESEELELLSEPQISMA